MSAICSKWFISRLYLEMCFSMLVIFVLLLSIPGNHSSNLTCISMPSLDHLTTTLYFICTCPRKIMRSKTGQNSFAQGNPLV